MAMINQTETAEGDASTRVLPEKIVVLSDGTGNSSAKVWRTNVWRIFDFLDLTGSDQVAMYDDGVGTSSFLPLALLGGAFGWGLKRNVIELYKFICRNYPPVIDEAHPAPKIYGFGFSRGAFTIRALTGLILHQGLAPYHSEEDLHVRARAAYRTFRADKFHSILKVETIFRIIRDSLIWLLDTILRRDQPTAADNRKVDEIEFLGLWDTVAAYGLPIDEMTRGFSQWIWPLELPDRVLRKEVQRACHALSIDDARTTFHPVLWTEEQETFVASRKNNIRRTVDERISQVWFVGSHANVGGGYPDDALAHIPLYWIMKEAEARGIKFKAPPLDPDALRKAASARDKDGRKYNSRAGIAGYYRYGPRKIADLCNARVSSRKGDTVVISTPKIHETVLLRIRSDSNAYAPIGLPSTYAVVSAEGDVLLPGSNSYESSVEADARARDQEKVWNIVWLRRIVYFLTLAASFHLAAFWAFHNYIVAHEFDSPLTLVSQFVRLVESFLPYQVVRWWTDYYATNPSSFAIGVVVLAALIGFGSRLESKITDNMRYIWTQRAQKSTIDASPVNTAVRDFRTNPCYQCILGTAKYHVLPFLSAVFLIYVGLVTVNHLALNIVDPTGVLCQPTKTNLEKLDDAKKISTKTINFRTNDICFPTGIYLTRGAVYNVTIILDQQTTDEWRDGDLPITPTPVGFRSADAPFWWRPIMYAAMPLRRIYFRRWFSVIGRIGSVGMDEDYLDPAPNPSNPKYSFTGGTSRIKRDGELFLYVNDAIIAFPGLFRLFYDNNQGTAQIRVSRK
jgi:uncharacterized protein (DUF2235 family)